MLFIGLVIVYLSWFDFGHSCEVQVDIPDLGIICGQTGAYPSELSTSNYESFLGIPFAEPPVNELRFQKPKPKKFETPFIANKTSPACYQVPLFAAMPAPYFSEDCLYLNIWRPNVTNHSLKPVLIYMHGGAFHAGTGSNHGGQKIAVDGDIVVVTINYRLGVFGLLFGGTEEIPGNMALFDQRLAFEWIHKNIEHFGGDPNRITISGTSAGALSVGHHLASVESQKFFQHAIAMSGSPMDYLSVDEPLDALTRATKFAKLVGCTDGNDIEPFTPTIIKCLQEADVEKLAKNQFSQEIVNLTRSAFNLPFLPVADGNFITKNVHLYDKYAYNSNKSVMFGMMPNEGAVLHYPYAENTIVYSWSPTTAKTAKDWIKGAEVFLSILQKLKFDKQKVMDYYFNGLNRTVNSQENLKAFEKTYYRLLSDILFTCPTLNTASMLFNRGANVYTYIFDTRATNFFQPCPVSQPCHAEDIFHLFDFGLPYLGEKTESIMKNYRKFIAYFVKKGKTNFSPLFNLSNKVTKIPYLDFNDETSIFAYNDEMEIGTQIHPDSTSCALWKPIFSPSSLEYLRNNSLFSI